MFLVQFLTSGLLQYPSLLMPLQHSMHALTRDHAFPLSQSFPFQMQ